MLLSTLIAITAMSIDLYGLGLAGLFIGTLLAGSFVPFSADALFVAFAAVYDGDMLPCLLVAIIGNWIGGMVTYLCGRLAKWEWVEKKFKIKPDTLARHKTRIDQYGVLTALVAWIPIFGQAVLLSLGFYKSKLIPTMVILAAGITIRFLAWALILG